MKAARALAGAVVIMAGGLMLAACGQQAAPAPTKLQSIHFDYDKYNVRTEDQGTMKNNAAMLQKNAATKVVVEGHCDERGSTEYNIALGDRRAKSAKSYLQSLGVAGDRMSTISYGEERPVCNQHNESCWWQNRRADFKAK